MSESTYSIENKTNKYKYEPKLNSNNSKINSNKFNKPYSSVHPNKKVTQNLNQSKESKQRQKENYPSSKNYTSKQAKSVKNAKIHIAM